MINWLRVALCMTVLIAATLVMAPVQILLLWLDRPQRRTLPRL